MPMKILQTNKPSQEIATLFTAMPKYINENNLTAYTQKRHTTKIKMRIPRGNHMTTKDNKYAITLFAIFIVGLLTLAGCTQSPPQVTPITNANDSSGTNTSETITTGATGVQYVSTDLQQCKVIRFVCVQGKEPFTDDRGCGCRPIIHTDLNATANISDASDINVTIDGKQYIHLNTNESTCSVINFMCLNGMQGFVDNKGCGCEPVQDQKPVLNYCTPDQHNQSICPDIDIPVCGWFSENVKCFAYPCAVTVSNGCAACQNPNVDYYTNGACPSSNPNASTDTVEGTPLTYKDPNKACTMEYAPVCIVLSDGSKHTMGNSCEASNVENVVSTTPGEC